jgi:hypothetical protein
MYHNIITSKLMNLYKNDVMYKNSELEFTCIIKTRVDVTDIFFF